MRRLLTVTVKCASNATTPAVAESSTCGSSLLSEAWELSPSVALRPEPFGALAYNFSTRKLTFLKRPELVSVVSALADHGDIAATLVAVGVPQAQWAAYEAAMRTLANGDMIRPRAEGEGQT